MSDYLRMSGLYWSLTFLDLSNAMEKLNKDEIVQFLKRNQHESGGFGPCGNLTRTEGMSLIFVKYVF